MNKLNFRILFTVSLIAIYNFSGIAQSKMEVSMGEKQFKMLQFTYGFYDNPEMLAVVTEVGQNLEKYLGLEYKLKYHLLDMEEPNAFATSGGYVYVTRGLLVLINSKDELAGVLGHELSHVTQRHNSKKMYANILPSVLEIPFNVVGLLTVPEVGDLLNIPIEAITEVGTAGFSREMESTADKLGVEVAAKAGYEPYALGDILTRLNDFVEFLTKEEMKQSIYIDHPMTPKRVKRINAQNKKNGFEYKSIPPGTEIQEIENLVFGQNPIGGIVMDSAFIHPGLGMYCEFPAKWQVNNSPQSITALSINKKVVIMVTMEESSYVKDLVKTEIEKHKGCEVITQGEKEMNGLKGYGLTLHTQDGKQVDKRLEIMWLSLPKNQTLVKVQAVSNFNDFPEEIVAKSFKTFRVAIDSDYSSFLYQTIELVKGEEVQIKENNELSKIINGVESGETIPNDRFVKVVKKHKLLDLKK